MTEHPDTPKSHALDAKARLGVEHILTNPTCGRACSINGEHEHLDDMVDRYRQLAECTALEAAPCDEPECPVHRGRGKTEVQPWSRGDERAMVHVDERGIVQLSEAVLGQLMLEAGWERSA